MSSPDQPSPSADSTSRERGPRQSQAVLVTGCSGGFGFRAARSLGRAGHRVIAGLRAPEGSNRPQATALTGTAVAEGWEVLCLPLDVDDTASVEGAVEEATRWAGPLDTVVNTAAYSVMGPLEACTPEQLLSMLNTNVVGALRLFRAVLPQMRGAGAGRIIQLTSGLGRAAVPFMGIFAAGAWAQECFAEVLAYEAAAFGVDVAILEPAGYSHAEGSPPDGLTGERRETRRGGPPLKMVGDTDRLPAYERQLVSFAEHLRRNDTPEGDPEEVAEAVVRAVEALNVPLRTPVGTAAKALIDLRSEKRGADYEQAITELTGLARFRHPE
ncbi:MAG: SDR family NAD(P)-dependent oxidoreductase [Bradymonadia bacterium]